MRIFSGETNFKFIDKIYYAFALSLIFILIGGFFYLKRGFSKGIDFTGGTLVEIAFKEKVQVENIRRSLTAVKLANAVIQEVSGTNRFFIKTTSVAIAEQAAVESDHLQISKLIRQALTTPEEEAFLQAGKADLNELSEGDLMRLLVASGIDQETAAAEAGKFISYLKAKAEPLITDLSELDNIGLDERALNKIKEKTFAARFAFLSVETVGPQVGKEIAAKTAWAVIWSLLAMLIYIALRFKFLFGLSAVITLFHDVLMLLAFILIMNIELSLPVVAAILTIIGYSINDTIVIFDRVRDNLQAMRKENLQDILDISINQTLNRTIITAGTTLISGLALLLFGGEVLKTFAMVLCFGLVEGTYSSIFQSCAWLKIWQKQLVPASRR